MADSSYLPECVLLGPLSDRVPHALNGSVSVEQCVFFTLCEVFTSCECVNVITQHEPVLNIYYTQESRSTYNPKVLYRTMYSIYNTMVLLYGN